MKNSRVPFLIFLFVSILFTFTLSNRARLITSSHVMLNLANIVFYSGLIIKLGEV